MNGYRVIWGVPVLAAVIGALLLLYGDWERRKAVQEVRRLFEMHLQSVASLAEKGTREATRVTSLAYELTEEHLLTTAHLLAVLHRSDWIDEGLLVDEEWRTRVVVRSDGSFRGQWGPVADSKRAGFLDTMRRAEQGEMVDHGVAAEYGLNCLYHTVPDGMAIVCRDAEKLGHIRREMGIGPLMKELVRRDVVYVALQDATGILAVAPSADRISTWQDDPALQMALRADPPAATSRMRRVGGASLFEGLSPFEMADGSRALLRVGVDASLMIDIEVNSRRRYVLLVALVLGIVLLVTLLTWLLWRWEVKRQETERVLAERKRERQHWEAIGQMAGTVAHEIRSPLNTLGMVAQRIVREFAVPEEQRQEFEELVGLLQSESQRVNDVVTEFLELGRPLHLKLERVKAEEAVREAVLPAQMRAETQEVMLELDNRCDGEVALDRARFVQMMGNLLGNALDAVGAGGRVRVSAECKADGLHIQVWDNGPGIDGDDIEEVLKPFVSFKSKGTGLGLPLVKRLVEAHGGRLELTSTPAKGTTARLFIPSSR